MSTEETIKKCEDMVTSIVRDMNSKGLGPISGVAIGGSVLSACLSTIKQTGDKELYATLVKKVLEMVESVDGSEVMEEDLAKDRVLN